MVQAEVQKIRLGPLYHFTIRIARFRSWGIQNLFPLPLDHLDVNPWSFVQSIFTTCNRPPECSQDSRLKLWNQTGSSSSQNQTRTNTGTTNCLPASNRYWLAAPAQIFVVKNPGLNPSLPCHYYNWLRCHRPWPRPCFDGARRMTWIGV